MNGLCMLKKFFTIIFLFTNLNANNSWYLNNKVENAQQQLKYNYSKLIDLGLIDKNTKINVNPDKRCFKSEGLKLLGLIELLEQNPSKQSIIVLDKLHNLYYLEFYKLINNLKCDEEIKISLISTLSDLFLPNLKKLDLPTFKTRTILTKTFIKMVVINKTISFHQTRKSAIALLLNQIKEEILFEKETLKKKDLDLFIRILCLNAAQPLVTKTTKRLIIASAVILTITIIIILTYKPYIKPGIQKIKAKAREGTSKTTQYINKTKNDLKDTLEKQTEAALDGFKKGFRDENGNGTLVSNLIFGSHETREERENENKQTENRHQEEEEVMEEESTEPQTIDALVKQTITTAIDTLKTNLGNTPVGHLLYETTETKDKTKTNEHRHQERGDEIMEEENTGAKEDENKKQPNTIENLAEQVGKKAVTGAVDGLKEALRDANGELPFAINRFIGDNRTSEEIARNESKKQSPQLTREEEAYDSFFNWCLSWFVKKPTEQNSKTKTD